MNHLYKSKVDGKGGLSLGPIQPKVFKISMTYKPSASSNNHEKAKFNLNNPKAVFYSHVDQVSHLFDSYTMVGIGGYEETQSKGAADAAENGANQPAAVKDNPKPAATNKKSTRKYNALKDGDKMQALIYVFGEWADNNDGITEFLKEIKDSHLSFLRAKAMSQALSSIKLEKKDIT